MTLPKGFPDRNITVIGLGYVGLTMAVAMADSGFQVHGVEIRGDVLDSLHRQVPPFWEPRLKEKLTRVIRRGTFTFSQQQCNSIEANVYIITVGTPLDEMGKTNICMVENAAREVMLHMKDNALVIMRSTVKLGTTRNVVSPIVKESGRLFQIAYCPERTLEGKALIELHELPQIIGADDRETRWRCQQIFGQITPTTIAVSSLEAAELVKLVDNTYRDITFGFANEIAQLCGRSGISAHEVIRAGKLGYERTDVALPGPVGGPCLEKDPHILVESARDWGVNMPIALASRRVNEKQPDEIADFLRIWVDRLDGFSIKPRIAILGLAFKGIPATDDLRGTMALPTYKALVKLFPSAEFIGYDPVVKRSDAQSIFDFSVEATIEDAFDRADVVIVQNNHPQFLNMEIATLASRMNRPGIIYDLWNLHDDKGDTMPEGIVSISLGSERISVY